MSIKISKHTKYVIDMLAADFNAEGAETNTNDDVLWRVLAERNPELITRAESVLGKRVKPKRGKARSSDE